MPEFAAGRYKQLPDPDDVGESEYRLVHGLIDDIAWSQYHDATHGDTDLDEPERLAAIVASLDHLVDTVGYVRELLTGNRTVTGTLVRHYDIGDGLMVEAKLTDEGVIVDLFDGDGDCVDTFGRTAGEFFDGTPAPDAWALRDQHGDDYEQWQHEVADGDTVRGWLDWLAAQREAR